MLSATALFIFPALMVLAALSDLVTMRIPNWLVLVLAGAFCVAAPIAGFPLELIGIHLVLGAVVLAATFGLFAAGWIGGGDAKFAAASVVWLGLGVTLPYLLYSALIGGALTLALLGLRRVALPTALGRIAWVARLHDKGTGIPYGIALAAGGLLVYPQSTIFLALAG